MGGLIIDSKIKQGEIADGCWVRSSYTTPNNNCVELRRRRTSVDVRDSKDAGGGTLQFGRTQWSEFLSRTMR